MSALFPASLGSADWIYMVTCVPAAPPGTAAGRSRIGEYLRSLRSANVESVLCRDEPLPGRAKLVPHLAIPRGC